MNVGIIGYGSMGKMLLDKFAASGRFDANSLFIANRTTGKIADAPDRYTVCRGNGELASKADIVFVCVRPVDMKSVLSEIKGSLKENALLVSLNGNIPFELLGSIISTKTAKVIPSVTAEIDRSQTLVCYNELVGSDDKAMLEELLGCIGTVIELPEKELGMGSELVSCMPGFIASIFDVICTSAKKHTAIPDGQIVKMVLNTLNAASELMLEKEISFGDVVTRVATNGGITEEGTKVVYEMFPETADKLFENALEKRRLTALNAQKSFAE